MTVTAAERPSSLAMQFSGRRYINLESYRRDGQPKLTPVQSLMENGPVYVQTDPATWKVKRIRNNPHVRIVPSDRNGKPKGTWVEGEAELLQGNERDRILRLFKSEYGMVGSRIVSLIARLRGERLTEVIRISLGPGLEKHDQQQVTA
jgi:uncharacterized protein